MAARVSAESCGCSEVSYRWQSAAPSLLRLHPRSSRTAERPQAVLREGICVPACRGTHIVAVAAAAVDGGSQAVVVARRLVAPCMVVGGVQVALGQRSVGVKLARGHAMQRRLRLVAVGAR